MSSESKGYFKLTDIHDVTEISGVTMEMAVSVKWSIYKTDVIFVLDTANLQWMQREV